jgi:hypothetical protein
VFAAIVFFCTVEGECMFWKHAETFQTREKCMAVLEQAMEAISINPKVNSHAGNCFDIKWPKVT